MALLVDRALRSVALERQVRQQTVAERVFDEMERGLSRLLELEEQRPFESYGLGVERAAFPFVVGYFQVDPDGSIHGMPVAAADERGGTQQRASAEEIERVVAQQRHAAAAGANVRPTAAPQAPGTTLQLSQGTRRSAQANESVARLKSGGEAEVSSFDVLRSLNRGVQERAERQKKSAEYEALGAAPLAAGADEPALGAPSPPHQGDLEAQRSAAELAPMTGRIVDGRYLLLSRTVVRETQAYRQGVLVEVGQLESWLRTQGLGIDSVGPEER